MPRRWQDRKRTSTATGSVEATTDRARSISVRVPRCEPFWLLPRSLLREWRGPRPYGRDGPPSRDGQLRGAWRLHRDGGLRGYDAPQPACDASATRWMTGYFQRTGGQHKENKGRRRAFLGQLHSPFEHSRHRSHGRGKCNRFLFRGRFEIRCQVCSSSSSAFASFRSRVSNPSVNQP